MNTQERKIAAFARMAELVVKKHIRERALNSYDYLGSMINNMQIINTTLMTTAVNVIRKMREDKEVNLDYMTGEFRKIIQHSVEQYTMKA
ncbi:MAG TPA: hypothetical protein VK167_14735 [Flavipsychrobacter sp.]|nr:hypothetical protein [Flavipsychrobacter sp.]